MMLTLTIVAGPIIVAGALGLAQWLTEGWTRSFGGYTSARRWLDRALVVAADEGALSLLDRTPGGVELALIDHEGSVVASQIDEIAAGDTLALETLLADLQLARVRPEVLVLDLADESGAAFLIALFRRPRVFESRPPWLPVVVTPIALLTPVVAMSIWILRDLRRSIITLRDAAVRIGSGDLDFHLDTTGNDEFAEVRSSFETMRRTIRDEYERRARFTMGVSHDLKTPLALIRGYAEAIEDGLADDPEKLERYVRIIRDRSDLLQERIAHLIEFLKMETGEWLSTLKPMRIRGFLEEAVDAARADARLAGRTVEASIDLDADLVVRLDPVLVRRALENLVANALGHSDEGAWVRIEAGIEGDELVIAVSNRGEPIAADRLDLLAEPLYRGDAARQTPGFGLGLAIVRSVVESHGWRLGVDGGRAGQTRFEIRIADYESGKTERIASIDSTS